MQVCAAQGLSVCSRLVILVCYVPCHAVLRSWFAIWFANHVGTGSIISFQVDRIGEIRAAQQ